VKNLRGKVAVVTGAASGIGRAAALLLRASGAAVVATDVGSDGEALQGAGIVLDLSNLEAQLALALRMLIEYPEFRHTLGEYARARVLEQYSLNHNLDILVRLYRELGRGGRLTPNDEPV
jgi:NAD(P)-dependent dehydrogenase (short-subunit alcohol dehydrogenase family)